MIDTALIYTMGFRVSEDRGHLLENIVFLQLKRDGWEIFFHKNQKECDFLLRKNRQIAQALQVTTTLFNPNVRKREVDGLREAMRTYQLSEGWILTENEEETMETEEGTIHVIPIWKWLLSLDPGPKILEQTGP